MKQPAQAVFLREERSFCAPLKKEGGGKQREPRDIWPVHSRGIFFQSVSSKIQRRNTKGNDGDWWWKLQRIVATPFFYWLKGGFARRGGIMSRGVQCIMESKECGQKAFLFSECRCKFVCSRTRDGEKELDEEGMKFSWKKGDDYGNSRSFFRRIFIIRRVNIYFIRIFL